MTGDPAVTRRRVEVGIVGLVRLRPWISGGFVDAMVVETGSHAPHPIHRTRPCRRAQRAQW
ncbi:hypothetical protein NJ76_19430 [Rhodococcus sp. IITR03]|nr:hypothetical protein NJ76_19430 [Rhodococcus sp. IITR03]